MAANTNLHKAKQAKNDEFYTRLADVENELRHYKEHFRDKIVFCNCDDPTWSAFWKYFHLNFEVLGLKKLVSTHYSATERTYKLEYSGGNDNDISIGTKTDLLQNGDFRSDECMEILKEADIIVSNPPFSLFREYIDILHRSNKKFLIVGNKNAITYKDFFPLIKNNEIWLGYNTLSEFDTPSGLTKKVNGLTRWFTNLDIKKRHENLILWQRYYDDNGKPIKDIESKYPKYDNYDAINIDKVSDIPCDYMGVMGVPITFLDKYNPEQFEIVGLLQSSTDEQAGIPNLRYYNDFKEMRQDMSFTGSSGSKANGNPVIQGKPHKGNFLYNSITKEYVHSVYARIVIYKKGDV